MRAHVEVDDIVRFACLDVALQLKNDFKDICEVQISGEDPKLKKLFALHRSSSVLTYMQYSRRNHSFLPLLRTSISQARTLIYCEKQLVALVYPPLVLLHTSNPAYSMHARTSYTSFIYPRPLGCMQIST